MVLFSLIPSLTGGWLYNTAVQPHPQVPSILFGAHATAGASSAQVDHRDRFSAGSSLGTGLCGSGAAAVGASAGATAAAAAATCPAGRRDDTHILGVRRALRVLLRRRVVHPGTWVRPLAHRVRVGVGGRVPRVSARRGHECRRLPRAREP